MFSDRIEGKWIDAFCEIFERCAVKQRDTAAILSMALVQVVRLVEKDASVERAVEDYCWGV